MTSQEEFSERLKRFDESENKGSYYFMFLNMIEKGFETEAFLFILSTWNFATFRYAMKDFDLNNFKDIVMNLKPYFQELSKIKGIQYTDASKLMHLTIPEVFVMWDMY